MRSITTVLLGAALALAGCVLPSGPHGPGMADGHGHPHMTGSTGPGWGNLFMDGSEDVVITVVAGQPEEFRFTPSQVGAAKAQRVGVTFTNNGTAPHEFDLKEFGFHLHAEPGQTVTGAFVAQTAGSFEFACHLPGHYEAGMKGVLTVAA